MKLITEELLKAHFKQHGDFMMMKNGMEITLEKNGKVLVTRPLTKDNRLVALDLMSDYKDLNSFIHLTQIQSIEDLNKIGTACCWGQYLQGQGYVSAIIFYYNNIFVNFRVGGGVTEVFSLDLHFYDEVEHTLSMVDQFNTYIDKQWPKKGFVELKPVQDGFIKIL
jgi:hypothetical protein